VYFRNDKVMVDTQYDLVGRTPNIDRIGQ